MQAVTIVQITPEELSTLIIDCVNSCLKYHKSLDVEKQAGQMDGLKSIMQLYAGSTK